MTCSLITVSRERNKASCDWLRSERGGAWRGRRVYRCRKRRGTLPKKHERRQIQRWNWFFYPFHIPKCLPEKINDAAVIIMSVFTVYKSECVLVSVCGGQPLSAAVFGEAVFKVLSVLVSCSVEGLVVLHKRLDLVLCQAVLFIWGHFRFILFKRNQREKRKITICKYLNKQIAVNNEQFHF